MKKILKWILIIVGGIFGLTLLCMGMMALGLISNPTPTPHPVAISFSDIPKYEGKTAIVRGYIKIQEMTTLCNPLRKTCNLQFVQDNKSYKAGQHYVVVPFDQERNCVTPDRKFITDDGTRLSEESPVQISGSVDKCADGVCWITVFKIER